MGRPKSPHGYQISRFNRLAHGVAFHGVLPSRGIDRCYHAEGCPIAEDQSLQDMCTAGDPCPYETWVHERYLASARVNFVYCEAWLTHEEFESIIQELSICELRYMRLHTLINREGLLREKRHPVSGYLVGQQMGLGAGRYGDAIDCRFNAAFSRLLGHPGRDRS